MMKTLAFMLGFALVASAALGERVTYYVSPKGSDNWSGRRATPNRDKTDGPFATPVRARDAARAALRSADTPRIVLLTGTYELTEPLTLGPEDSGLPASPVIWEAGRGAKPVLSGGRRLAGWRKTADEEWEVPAPAGSDFGCLWVNGNRRYRPRLPREGFFSIAGELPPSDLHKDWGFDGFVFPEGSIRQEWSGSDVEVLTFQNWTMYRFRVLSVDDATRTVRFDGATPGTSGWARLAAGNRFLVENPPGVELQPGEWRLHQGALRYRPLPGEEPDKAAVVVPVSDRLLDVTASNIVFRGITFAHTNWVTPKQGHAFPQAEVDLGAAVNLRGARNVAFQRCSVAHTGAWAVDIGSGCRNVVLEGCAIHDLGAGGVKIGATSTQGPDDLVADNVVRDCRILHGGRLHPAGVGVWIGHSYGNTVEHNEIGDLYYTGVSVGWTWGYGDSPARDNTIAWNHIHDIGHGLLSDMGGIYTLGISPGTTLHHNLIHDVNDQQYGGWGIYFDEGSTNIRAFDNIVYRCRTGNFHQHYGSGNIVTNNVFALGTTAELVRTRAEEHRSFTLENNIVWWKDGPLLGGNWSGENFVMSRNVYWRQGEPFDFAGQSFDEWRKRGHDAGSVIADPGFRNPEKGDFRLKDGSPALALGIHSVDLRAAGPRKGACAAAPKAKGAAVRAWPESGQEG
jgi:hypothetical protein